MEDILINIIIPCYYPSEVIEPCFESLAKQSAKNQIQIFMVNDCSPNTSCEYSDLREKYRELLNIIYLKTNKNSGPGVARQIGLDNINNSAKWIMFIDDDDCLYDEYVIENYIKLIKQETLEYRLSFLAGKRVYFNGKINISDDFTGLTGSLFNIDIIKLFNLSFQNCYYDEDTLFFIQYFYYNEILKNILISYDIKLEVIHDSSFFSYQYNSKNNLSITHNINQDSVFSFFNLAYQMILFFEPLLSIDLFKNTAINEIKVYFVYLIVYSLLIIEHWNDVSKITKQLIFNANNKMFSVMNLYPLTIIESNFLNLILNTDMNISPYQSIIKFNNLDTYKNYYNKLNMGEI